MTIIQLIRQQSQQMNGHFSRTRPHLQRSTADSRFSQSSSSLREMPIMRSHLRQQEPKQEGITLNRKKRMSFDKLYEKIDFKCKKVEESTSYTLSNSTMTGRVSFSSPSSSKKSISLLQGSQVSQLPPKSRREILQPQTEIMQAYYPLATHVPTKNGPFFDSSVHRNQANSVVFQKKYNLNGIIRF